MKTIDKLVWLHLKNRHVLFVRSKGQSIFYTVGGKREEGETDEAALIREVTEELNVTLIASTLKYANTFENVIEKDGEPTNVKLTCYYADTTGTPQPSSEIEEMAWINTSTKKTISENGVMVLEWLNNEGLID
ncbi:MAG: NUDIX domain-containing protein [bacterium]|nr:NUDIX domain-containing protein [bacterium]